MERYRRYFKNPIIHEHNMRHEELLGVYPDKWVEEIVKICMCENDII